MEKTKSVIIAVLGLLVVALGASTIILGIQVKNHKGDDAPLASSQENAEAVVITASLNVRQEPNQTSQRVGALTNGQKVVVLGHEEGWTHIEFNGLSGYVKSEFLSEEGYIPSLGEESVVSMPRGEESQDGNMAERNANSQSEIGVFTPDNDSKDYYAYTKNGYICIHVPEEASDVSCEGEKLSYHLKRDWIDILFVYNIDLSLADKYDTERRIVAKTSTLPENLPYYEYEGVDPLNIAYDLGSEYDKGNSGFTAWRKKVWGNGASYFFIGPVNENDGNRQLKIYEEAYNYIDEVAMHEVAEILYYDFFAYKNSFDTTMAQNEAQRDFDEFTKLLSSCIEDSVVGYVDGSRVGYSNSFEEFYNLFRGGKSLIIH